MTAITSKVWINAPKQQVWQALADFGNISIFNPAVPNSYLTSDQTSGVGMTRHCDLALAGASIEERVIEWTEGQSMQIEIYEGKKSPPFQRAVASIHVTTENGGTVVEGTLEYTLKFGPVGALMDSMMVKSQFKNAWQGLFAGLKHYIETGEEVDSPRQLNFEPVAVTA